MTRRTGTVADMEMAPMDVPQYRDTFGDDGSTGSGQVLSMDVDYVSQVKRRKKTMSYLAVAALVLCAAVVLVYFTAWPRRSSVPSSSGSTPVVAPAAPPAAAPATTPAPPPAANPPAPASIPAATPAATPAPSPAADGGRLIRFFVANLDGNSGESGSFTVLTHPEWAPIGVERFEALTEVGFWDGARIFRVLPTFVAQWGISEDPAVQAKWGALPLDDDPVVASNTKGTITFATSGPDSRTTQVFVNVANNGRLDSMGFSPIGEIVEGMDVALRFYSGYGEGAPSGNGPSQGMMERYGEAYTDVNFPLLSYFTGAEFVDE